MYDFAVVGAGPAGSYFSHKSSQRGNDIIVLESGEVGAPLSCSGHVSLDLWDHLKEKNKSELIQNEIFGARFHVEGHSEKTYKFYKDEPISNVIDRVGLDRCLADMARKSGAEVKERHTVIGVEEFKEKTLVKVRCPEGKKEIEAKMVVGCDGPKSRVGRSLGIESPDEFLHGILGFESAKNFGDFVDVYLNIPGFFSWRIPRGDAGVEYGIAGSMNTDIIGKFEELLGNLNVEVENKCSGIIPIGPPKCVSYRRGFLIGDSAGQTKPFTGGGILYGMAASECAARVVDPNKPETIKLYEMGWRKDIGNEIKMGKLIRKGYSLPRSIQRVGLGFLSGKIGVHMDRPTSLFSGEQFGAMFMRGRRKYKR